jgi:hypothetical protein
MRKFNSLLLVGVFVSCLFATSCKLMSDLVPPEANQTASPPAQDANIPLPPGSDGTSQGPKAAGQWPEGQRMDIPKGPPHPTAETGGINGGSRGTVADGVNSPEGGAQTPPASTPPPEDEFVKMVKSLATTPEAKQMVEAVLQTLADRPDKAIALIDQFEPSVPQDKKMLVQMLKGYVNLKLGNMEKALEQWDALHRTLKEQMPLAIIAPKMCRKVDSFGKYEEFGHYVFGPGKGLILYFEPQYFVCKQVENQYLVTLNAKYSIIDKDGNQVWQAENSIEHKTTHYLYDLFMTKPMKIPTLADGNYTLKILLQDMNKPDQEKPVEATIQFEVRHDIQ